MRKKQTPLLLTLLLLIVGNVLFSQSGSITTRVWNDKDGDGIQDGNENAANISDVVVYLLDASNSDDILQSTFTIDGIVTFLNVPLNTNLKLKYDLPIDHKFTGRGSSLTTGNNSDVFPSGNKKGTTDAFKLTSDGQEVTFVDAGMWAPGSVEARVWNDLDGDGVQDGNENGADLEGIKVHLQELNGDPVFAPGQTDPVSANTNADGLALLNYLPADRELKLKFDLPADHKFTGRGTSIAAGNNSDAFPSGNKKATTDPFKVTKGSHLIEYIDAGMWAPGTVKTRVWNDLDGDGIQDGNENDADLEGVVVHLLELNGDPVINPDGNVAVKGTTDTEGIAELDYLPADRELKLEFDLPADHRFTERGSSITAGNNSDAFPSGNKKATTDPFKVTKGSHLIEYVDAGLWAPGSVKARVWNDLDGDGKQDGNENNANLSGVVVHLLETNGNPVIDPNDNEAVKGTTDGSGIALLDYLPADRDLKLEFDLPTDHKFTGRGTSISDGNNSDAFPSGNKKATTDPFKVTKGSHLIEYVDAGLWAPGTVKARVWNDLDGDGKQDGNENGSNLAGVLVHLQELNGTAITDPNTGTAVSGTTDENGIAMLNYLPADRDVKLKFDLPADHKFTGRGTSISDGNNSDAFPSGNKKSTTDPFKVTKGSHLIEYVDAGMWAPGIVKTRVWFDKDGDGKQDGNENAANNNIFGMRVNLLETNGDPVLKNGNPVYALTECGTGVATLSYVPADRQVKLEYVLFGNGAFTVRGTSISTGNNSDAFASGNKKSTTDPFEVTKGSHVIEYVDAGLTTRGDWDDAAVESLVWNDVSSIGTQSNSERNNEGIEGVKVSLLDMAGNTCYCDKTDADGKVNLPAIGDRQYRLQYDLPVDHKFTTKQGSLTQANNSDVFPSGSKKGITDKFTLTSGAPAITYIDAGMWVPGTVKARVWNDLDGDGIQDGSENGANLVGIKVHLQETNGDPVFAPGQSAPVTALTDANGIALIDYFPADRDLKLKFDLPLDHKFTSRGSSIGAGNNSDAFPSGSKKSTTDPFKATKGSDLIDYVDAGMWAPGSIEARVWNDLDGDGIQDGSENGANLANIKVHLQETNGDPVFAPGQSEPVTGTTNASGIAFIGYLPADRDLKLKFDLPADHKFTGRGSSIAAGNNSDAFPTGSKKSTTDPFKVTKGSHLIDYVDAGMWAPGSIEARVWNDLDGDGIQDGSEGGANLAGILVHLLETNGDPVINPNGNVAVTGETMADGVAILDYLPADRDLKLKFDLPADHKFTGRGSSIGAGNNSDAFPSGSKKSTTDPFKVTKGSHVIDYVDAGMWAPGMVKARVWNDLDGDGKQDGSENGANLEGVLVHLLETNNAPVLDPDGLAVTGTTDENGIATLDYLPADRDLKLEFDLPADHKFTGRGSSIATGNNSDAFPSGSKKAKTDPFKVTKGSHLIEYVDAGMWAPGIVEARVWIDVDGDGKQDGSENGGNNNVFGMRVNLLETNGDPVLRNGSPVFGITECGTGIATLDYVPADRDVKLEFVLFDGGAFTVRSSSITTGNNSDAFPSGSKKATTDPFKVTKGSHLIDYVDAGLTVRGDWDDASIESFVWDDVANLGTQSSSERNSRGIEGVKVRLVDVDGNTCYCEKTNASGKATLPGIGGRQYRLRYDLPADHKFTTKSGSITVADNSDADVNSGQTAKFTLNVGDKVTYVDAGMWAPGTLETFVWDDVSNLGTQSSSERNSKGLGGVTVELREEDGTTLATAVTADNGKATFPYVPADRDLRLWYNLPADHKFTTKSGSVTVDNNSDADVNSGQTAKFKAARGSDHITYVDAGLWAPGTLETFVWDDVDNLGTQSSSERNSKGIEGVIVELREEDGTKIATAVTASNGKATFPYVPANRDLRLWYNLPDDYKFTTKTGSITTDNNSDADVNSGQTAKFKASKGSDNITYVDGGMWAPGTVETFVWNDDGNGEQSSSERNSRGIDGVTVELREEDGTTIATAVTANNGKAVFTDVPADRDLRLWYDLPPNHKFTPKSGSITDDKNSDADVNSGQTAKFKASKGSDNTTYVDAGMWVPGRVEAFVWNDDGNGIQSSSERNSKGIDNVLVQLREANGINVIATTTTTNNGKAIFNDVPADRDLRLWFNLPAGHKFTPKSGSITDGNNSDADVNSGLTAKFKAIKGSDNTTYVDAGMWAPGTVTAFVWEDDGNGLQSSSERNSKGIAGVFVELLDASANGAILANTFSVGNGVVTFNNVPADRDLRLRFKPLAGYNFTPKTGDIDDTNNSDADTNSGQTAKFKAARGSDNITYVDAGFVLTTALVEQPTQPTAQEEVVVQQTSDDPRQPLSTLAPAKGRSSAVDQLILFPVPATDVINIRLQSDLTTKAPFRVLDAQGRVVRQDIIEVFAGDNQFQLDLDQLASGTYYYQVVLDKQVLNKSFIVLRR